MKISVIGNGHVGMAVFGRLIYMQGVNELALIGRNVKKVQGEVADYLDAGILDDGAPLELTAGSYDEVAGSDVIIYTAGPSVSAWQNRLDILDANTKAAEEIFTAIRPYCKKACVVCISNPIDVLTYLIPQYADMDPARVMGTGTLLDSARLKRFIADLFDVAPRSIEAVALGEHGFTAAVMWNSIRIGGLSLDDYAEKMIGKDVKINKDSLQKKMRDAGYKIHDQKGSTAYGVANSAARIASAIIHDKREIMPVSTSLVEKYGFSHGACSLPCIIGRGGVMDTVKFSMSPEEEAALAVSFKTVQQVILDFEKSRKA
jgi:L-lactate dehydrogenase